MILRISTPASAWIESTDVTNDVLLASLGGIVHDEVFSEYFIDDIDPIVKELKADGGKLHFRYDTEKKLLWAQVDYGVQSRLTSQQAESLTAYTLGQLSDGIGNNFVQDYVDKTGVFVEIRVDRDKVKFEYL